MHYVSTCLPPPHLMPSYKHRCPQTYGPTYLHGCSCLTSHWGTGGCEDVFCEEWGLRLVAISPALEPAVTSYFHSTWKKFEWYCKNCSFNVVSTFHLAIRIKSGIWIQDRDLHNSQREREIAIRSQLSSHSFSWREDPEQRVMDERWSYVGRGDGECGNAKVKWNNPQSIPA